MAHQNTGDELLQIGEFARSVGKTVRAIHLYEELGLLRPTRRTKGGFRLYHRDAMDRVNWITKLQAIGFSLSEIQSFVSDFEEAPSGRDATARVRAIFEAKRDAIREQILQLEVIANDLGEALDYLDACGTCSTSYAPSECHACDHEGHEPSQVPELFAGLSEAAASADVDVSVDEVAPRAHGSGESN